MISENSPGFTIIELIIVMAIIAIMTSFAFFDFTSFTSHSSVRTRTAELAEYLWYAQEHSSAGEVLSPSAVLPTRGFQVVRVEVREGVLHRFRLEKAPGVFQTFDGSSPFAVASNSTVPDNFSVMPRPQEEYYVDVCFITVGSTPSYTRRKLELAGDTACNFVSMLCDEPDPSISGYSAKRTARNNFDIHFSVEQPTREVHTNLLPIERGSYVYSSVEPNRGNRRDKRVSDVYAGVRVVFISPEGVKRSVDVYQTGLVSVKSSDNLDGCSAAL